MRRRFLAGGWFGGGGGSVLILPSSYSLNPVIQILSHSHPNPLSPPWLKIREQRKIKDKDKDKILNILCSSYLNPNPLSHYSHDHLFTAQDNLWWRNGGGPCSPHRRTWVGARQVWTDCVKKLKSGKNLMVTRVFPVVEFGAVNVGFFLDERFRLRRT